MHRTVQTFESTPSHPRPFVAWLGAPLAWLRASRRAQLAVLLGPALAWVLALIVAPGVLAFLMSFWRADAQNFVIIREFSLNNYARIFEKTLYYGVLLKTIRIAATVMVCTLALAIPLAYTIAFKVRRHKPLWYAMVVVALWMGYVIRAYAWRILFGNFGIINTFLLDLGLIREPLAFLLFNPFTVIVALTHLATPFALMPIYATLEQIPRELHEAAADLGAGRWRTFVEVTLPLSLHGIIAGAAFAFILSFGDFFAPVLLGGADSIMVANVVASQFGVAYQWPLGTALALLMFLVVILVLAVPDWVQRRLFRGPRHAEVLFAQPAADVRGRRQV